MREAAQAQDRPESQPRSRPAFLAKSIETSQVDDYRRTDYSAPYEDTSEESSYLKYDTDPKQEFYQKWGYLPPLDEEAIAIIEAIIADPDMAQLYTRIGPEKPQFPQGLSFRNVFTTESEIPDLCAQDIQRLEIKNLWRRPLGKASVMKSSGEWTKLNVIKYQMKHFFSGHL